MRIACERLSSTGVLLDPTSKPTEQTLGSFTFPYFYVSAARGTCDADDILDYRQSG